MRGTHRGQKTSKRSRGSSHHHKKQTTREDKGTTRSHRTERNSKGSCRNQAKGQHKGGAERDTTQGHQHRRRRQGAGRQQRKEGERAHEDQRQQRKEGERAHEDQSGCTHALVNIQRGTWNIKDEYLSAAAQSNTKSLQGGVEGENTPHRAEPLVPP